MQGNKRYSYEGKEVCVFPIDMMNCSQTAGLDANGNLLQTLSHNKNLHMILLATIKKKEQFMRL